MFSRLCTVARYYKTSLYLTVPSALGFSAWQYNGRKNLLEDYHESHIEETLKELRSTPKDLIQESLVSGLIWPLGYFWVRKHLDITNKVSSLSDEEMNQTIIRNHIIHELRENMPLDHMQKVGDYLLRHEKEQNINCPLTDETNISTPKDQSLLDFTILTIHRIL